MAGTAALVAMLTRHQEPLAVGHFLWWAEVEAFQGEGEGQVVVDPFQEVGVEVGVQDHSQEVEGVEVGVGLATALLRGLEEEEGVAVAQLALTLKECQELEVFLAWQPVPASEVASQLAPGVRRADLPYKQGFIALVGAVYRIMP